MRAYSYDLRQRAVRAVDQRRSRTEIVTMFGISLATLKRYLKRRDETGDVQAKPIPGRPAKKGAALQAGLKEQLEAHPDATLEQHCSLWGSQHGMKVSPATMSRVIRRLGWTRKKKTLGAVKRSEEARAAWRTQAETASCQKTGICRRMWLPYCFDATLYTHEMRNEIDLWSST